MKNERIHLAAQSHISREASREVRVCAPCRLHFGMFGFGCSDRPQYGGVGVMVEPPGVEVHFLPAAKFEVVGAHAARALQFVEAVFDKWHVDALPACRIEVVAPPDHTGLGIGTQLALAVAAGLRRFMRLPQLAATELSAQLGRGGRSAVGTFGFESGGLIVDAGKMPEEQIGRLERQLELPAAWRIVLLRPTDARGLAGEREAAAFANLPPVPGDVTESLWRITREQILPAAEAADCDAFGEAVYDFGRRAGECFAAAQGGPFASRAIEQLIDDFREHGVPGVGQSSWGPTVFAIVPSDDEAQKLVKWIQRKYSGADLDIAVARPNNSGAVFVP